MAVQVPPGKLLALDLTDPEDEDTLRVSEEGLADLALSLPPGTDLAAYLRERPDLPMAQAVLSGKLRIPETLPQSAIGYSQRLDEENLPRLMPHTPR